MDNRDRKCKMSRGNEGNRWIIKIGSAKCVEEMKKMKNTSIRFRK